MRKYLITKCIVCGEEFKHRSDYIPKHCSPKCRGISKRNKPKICLNCGCDFISKYHHKTALFCSNKCSLAYRSKKIELECDNCQKKIIRTPSFIKNHNFCSNKCSGEYHSKIYVEDKHPQWMGDGAGYLAKHAWIGRHFDDPQKCEICGEKDKKLNWARKNHNKVTRRREDYIRMCISCHRKYDFLNNGYNPRKNCKSKSGS